MLTQNKDKAIIVLLYSHFVGWNLKKIVPICYDRIHDRINLKVKLNLERCNQSEYQKVLLCTNRSCWIIDKSKLWLPQRLKLSWMFIKCQIQNIQNDNVLPDQEKTTNCLEVRLVLLLQFCRKIRKSRRCWHQLTLKLWVNPTGYTSTCKDSCNWLQIVQVELIQVLGCSQQ